MKKILNKIIHPKYLLILFILFNLSIFILHSFMDYMYANQMTNISIVLFYFIPLLLFFTISSIYNFIKFKNSKGTIKIIVLIPLIIIILYFIYTISILSYAIFFRKG